MPARRYATDCTVSPFTLAVSLAVILLSAQSCSMLGRSEYFRVSEGDMDLQNDYRRNNSYHGEMLRLENTKPNIATYLDSNYYISVKLGKHSGSALLTGPPLLPVLPIFLLGAIDMRVPGDLLLEIKIGLPDTSTVVQFDPDSINLEGDKYSHDDKSITFNVGGFDTQLPIMVPTRLSGNHDFNYPCVDSFLTRSYDLNACRWGIISISYHLQTFDKNEAYVVHLDGIKINDRPLSKKSICFVKTGSWDYIGFFLFN